ncbi:MAG: ABC transporter ATP-binding protein [Tepidisphaeraceae bacterium]
MAADHALEEEVFTGRIDYGLWRRILVFARPYRRELVWLAVFSVIVAACDVAMPYLTGRIVDQVKLHGGARLREFALLYFMTIAVFAFCVLMFILLAGRITTGVSHDIRAAAFNKLQDLPFSYYDTKAVGWLMARLTSDCNNLSRVMGWALLDICWGLTVLTMIGLTMLALNAKLALAVLVIVPPLWFVSRYFQVRLLLTSRAMRKTNSIMTGAFNEGIVGVRTSKSLVREQQNLHEFSEISGTMYGHALRNGLYSAMFLPLVLSICSLGVGLALWRGGVQVAAGAVTLGTLVAFLQYAGLIAGPAQELANTLTMIQGAQASAERVQGLLDTPLSITDSDEVRARMTQNRSRNDETAIDGYPNRIVRIEFRDVTFAYKQGQTVLRSFNLTVEAGQTIALVGPTGGGKTTIVGLVCRFYEPSEGQVLINGVDYRERSLHWLQSNLGMVLQQPHLFSGTVRENIRYGRLAASDDEVERAARLTNAHDFIAAMKDGYDSGVGEGGNQLSTGQKQLVALARAVLADPQIFVMDEATSSVDTQTERAIQAAVENVLANRISFVIAHRLSTIRSADRILVIDAGKIVEDGTHHDLLKHRGKYYELYTNQFTHEHEEQLLAAE